MGYYLRRVGLLVPNQIWRIDEVEAVKLGVTNPQEGPGTYYRAEPGETIWQALARQTPWMTGQGIEPFFPLDLAPRRFRPRIGRPLFSSSDGSLVSPSAKIEAGVVAMGRAQAVTLLRRLELICQTVHPAPDTLGTYGHEVRNLLILATTEVETHWRGVLVANGVDKKRYTTKDYHRLLEPMRLDGYEVTFPSLPWLEPIRPFAGWSAQAATGSLEWYDAYNGVKHNRELEFPRANLANAFLAVSAVVVMLAAQFSRSLALGGQSELSAFFRFSERPEWHPGDLYADVTDEPGDWIAEPLWPS